MSAIFLSAILLGGGATAYGQETNVPGDAQFQQRIADRLAELSQIQNKGACAEAANGYASCGVRVVVDSSGRARANVAPSGYGPSQFLGAYDLTGLSSSNTIAIVDAYDDPNIASDLSTYDSYFKLPVFPACSSTITTSCFEKLNENGKTSPLPQSNSSWDLEISLDVEVAHATCQNCRIFLVEANSSSFADLLKAVDTAASNSSVVSGSWGASEFSGETAYDSTFDKTGVAFTFSAGDGGYGTSYPAASPYVTAVGGTTLLLNGNSYLSESVWSGTGSGCSVYETKPAWQNSPCAKRTMNDVSADANPATGAAIYDSVPYDGVSGWFEVGGTSLSAPLIAAVYALQGVPSGVKANALPYSQGTASNLNKVTTGSNGSCGTYLCNAADALLGYSGPIGVGTPRGTSAF